MSFTDRQKRAADCLLEGQYPVAIALYKECLAADPTVMSNYWHLGLAEFLQGEELEAREVWLSGLTQGNLEEIERRTIDLVKVLEAEAIRLLNSGNFQQSERIYWQIIELAPNYVPAYANLATVLVEQNKLDEAIACLQKFIELKPDFPEGYDNLGNVLIKKGYIKDAIACYQQAIILNPNDVAVYKKLGNAFLTLGHLDEAIDAYQQAVNCDPNYLDANYIEVYNNMGVILEKQGQLESAVACYQQAIHLKPDYLEAYNNLGIVFTKQGQLDNAVACYQQALNIAPTSIETYNNLGVVFRKQGQLDNAIACYQRALNLNPNYPEGYNSLGVACEDKGWYEQAKACYMQAIELNPNYALAHFNLALLLLRTGEFKLGFVEYEWRWQCSHNLEYYPILNLPQPFWDGSNLNGRTILLHAEQGFGDTIQFIRYVPLIAHLGGRVIVECHEPLERLLRTVPGIDQLVVKGEPLPEFDVHAPLMSLPRILGTTLENLPAGVPYLEAPNSSIKLNVPTGCRLKVGIVWAGSSKNPTDSRRSCSLNHFSRLVNIPNIAFYSLQKEASEEELTQLADELQVQDLSSHLDDFADTAGVIAQLDLVIAVDTAVAHLAGALNRPVWTLLSFVPDWRWMIERLDSPWYPSMRLFRQHQPGDWEDVFKQVAKALQSLAGDSCANLSKDSSGLTKSRVPQGKGFKPKPSKKRRC